MPHQKKKKKNGEKAGDLHTKYFCMTKSMLKRRIDKETRQERYFLLYKSQKHVDLELNYKHLRLEWMD